MREMITKEELFDIYEQLMFKSQRAMAVVDFNLVISFTNQAAVETYEYTLEEAVGRPLNELIFGEETNLPPIITAFEAVAKGQEQTLEMLLYSKSKKKIFARAHLFPLFDDNNLPNRCCVYAVDISSERNIEYKLSVAENKYQEVLDNCSDVFIEIDTSGCILFVNKSWEKISGYTAQETIGRNYLDCFPEQDKESSLDNFKKLLNKEISELRRDIQIFSKNGEMRWLDVKSSLKLSPSGDTLGLSVVLRDITEEITTRHYHNLFSNNITDLVAIHNMEKQYVYVSPSSKFILGYEPEELIGKVAFDLIHPQDLPNVIAYRDKVIAGKNDPNDSIVCRFKRKDGQYIWVDTSSKYFYDEVFREMRTITSTRISEKRVELEKRLQEKLEAEKRLNKLKSSFVSFVSHEFRTPLAIIKATVEYQRMVLTSDMKDFEDIFLKDLDNIESEITGLTQLMNDVLIIEKAESNHLNLNHVNTCLVQQIKHTIARIQEDKGTAFGPFLKVVGVPVLVSVDPKYIELIFTNLITNAIKYSRDTDLPPVVTISYSENSVQVSVKDFGIGIPKKNHNKIFNTFFRAENIGDIEGTGLGLSIVKKLVELHNGTIMFDSEENSGTEMIVELPLAKKDLKPARMNLDASKKNNTVSLI